MIMAVASRVGGEQQPSHLLDIGQAVRDNSLRKVGACLDDPKQADVI
jgi:hypothetical protein